jgi:S1-C subfamily serine protease
MTLRSKVLAMASTAILLTTPVLSDSGEKAWNWASDTQTSTYIYQTQSLGVENIVPRVINSVVTITTMKSIVPEEVKPVVAPDLPKDKEENGTLDDFLEDSKFIPAETMEPQDPRKEKFEASGFGTGFFIGKNLIVTNHHVIEGGVQDEYLVSIYNKKWYAYKAHLVSADDKTDIAILEIINPDRDIETIVPLRLSRTLPRVGEPLFAIGHPHGLLWTVTQGSTSFVNRKLNNIWQDLVQTDTPVNPGNSGGPLFNLRGEVVGVNVMILGAAGDNQPNETGLNFAVTSEVTTHVVNELLQYDRVRRPKMGVSIDDFEELNATGVYVKEVEEGSPAEKAGIMVHDTISGADKTMFRNSMDFFRWFAKLMPNDRVELRIVRDDESIILPITLDERLPETGQ